MKHNARSTSRLQKTWVTSKSDLDFVATGKPSPRGTPASSSASCLSTTAGQEQHAAWLEESQDFFVSCRSFSLLFLCVTLRVRSRLLEAKRAFLSPLSASRSSVEIHCCIRVPCVFRKSCYDHSNYNSVLLGNSVSVSSSCSESFRAAS